MFYNTFISCLYMFRAHFFVQILCIKLVNPLTPNDHYRGRTAPLTSKRCILYIYSTNIGTEYFKHGIHSPFFPLQNVVFFHNSNVFGSCIIYILYKGWAQIKKKNNSGAKRLITEKNILRCTVSKPSKTKKLSS